MRYFIILLVLVGFILTNAIATQAQTPGSAVSAFQDGLKKSGRGDLDGAITGTQSEIARDAFKAQLAIL